MPTITTQTPAKRTRKVKTVTPPAAATTVAQATIPPSTPIGQHLPGVGHYCGIASDLEGGAMGHLVLLDDKPADRMAWKNAKAWAEGLGDGARLPTKAEAALLFANLKAQFEPNWHWTGTQYSDYGAWFQYFYHGYQNYYSKSYEARARAVRRLPLQSFNTSDTGAQ